MLPHRGRKDVLMALLGPSKPRHTVRALKAKGYDYWKRQPAIEHGHFDNLVFDDGQHRVWVSRATLADYDGDRRAYLADRLTIEHRVGGAWVRA
jgi:hypothetical protein